MEEIIIANIGKANAYNDYQYQYQKYVQEIYPNSDYKVILLEFTIIEKNETFLVDSIDVNIENNSPDNDSYLKYCYRKGSANGGDITHTTKLGDLKDFTKKLNTLKKVNAKILSEYAKTDYDKKIFTALKIFFDNQNNINNIEYKLKTLLSGYSKNEKFVLSLNIYQNNQKLYLCEFEAIQNAIIAAGTDNKSFKYDTKSEGYNEVCSICLKKKAKLHGFASPFKYYSLDKKNFAPNFFDISASWMNFPICSECADDLEIGKNYIEKYLKRKLYGFQYFIIPKPIINNIDLYKKSLNFLNNYKPTDNTKSYQEDKFLEYVGRENNFFNINLIFFEEDPVQKNITLNVIIEDIFPSRFRKVFVEVPSIVNNNSICKLSEDKIIEFSLSFIKDIFLEKFPFIIYNIFKGIPIKKEYIFNQIYNFYTTNYYKQNKYNSPYIIIIKSILLYQYFSELNLIMNKGEIIMEDVKITETNRDKFYYSETLTKFIQENNTFFDEDVKVGIFAVGMLARCVLYLQHKSLGNTPFEKKFKGLKISPKTLMNIYTEATAKILQYEDLNSFKNLRELAARYYVLNQDKVDKLTVSEISTIFLAGVELGNNFIFNKQGD